ncbi:DUF1932 domain-containing protein [Kordiimonas lipolytica]|uniref:DUF1932 domain-containing protein n=1 Tax=Kordiimonas lipolytica TaxID=1662421 RepID=A0ABV8U7D4_9PROT|nr:NAD(P)-dependent oxidoreductase [Kordiimonas lipolytica]
MTRIALIGFGEVGQTLAEDLVGLGHKALTTYDIQFPDAASKPSKAMPDHPAVTGCRSAADAVADADLVISAVTAERTGEAAASCVGYMKQGAWFMDVNSASPKTKVEAAMAVNDAGGRYVETSIMSPIGPKRIKAPMLVSGDHALAFTDVAHSLGFTGITFFSATYGQASAAKMCRSVIVKGVEALVTEALASAHHYGVEDTVIKSLGDLFPGLDWPQLSSYMMSRALIHGKRRAEEMREVAKTVADAGMEPLLSDAIAKRQDWSAALQVDPSDMALAELLETISSKKEGVS